LSYVYILMNDDAGCRYVGQTDDLERRFVELSGECC
jgi:predicted GIY-YIG superfamily endonuclease